MSIRRDDVRRLVHEHLNASMLMVALDEPLEPGIPISEALAYLDENGFDLALLRSPEVRIVYRDQLAQVDERNRGNPVKSKARNPRADRLIEHSLELGEVARRLREDAVHQNDKVVLFKYCKDSPAVPIKTVGGVGGVVSSRKE